MINTEELLQDAAALGLSLSSEQSRILDRYCSAVVQTNKSLNLTTITDPQEMKVKHLLDCLAICTLPCFRGRVVDIGTGAGFPGVVMAVMRPDLEMSLMDATAKKLHFVQTACAELGIPVQTIHGRAEDLARKDHREKYDAATARAVAPLASLLEYCLPLVRTAGYFVAMKGSEIDAEIAASRHALRELGGEISEIRKFTLPGDIVRSAVVIQKIHATSLRYPRTGKNISKKPITAAAGTPQKGITPAVKNS